MDREMAVHMGPNDGYGLVITVGSGYRDKKSGQKKEHNPPHAHIYTTDKSFESRFRIDSENPPKSGSEIETVSPDDKTLGKFADTIAKWAKEPSKRFQGTNWQSMRQSWKDIQDIISLGLAEHWYNTMSHKEFMEFGRNFIEKHLAAFQELAK
jgi:hypothetical protein